MSRQEAIRRYDNYLLGKGDLVLDRPTDVLPLERDFVIRDERDSEMYQQMRADFRRRADEGKERDALAILAYIFRNLMQMTPQEALITMQGSTSTAQKINEIFALDKVLSYISFPPGISRTNYEWLFAKIFPHEIEYDEEQAYISLYHELLSGKINRFPRRYFMTKATQKLCVMLRDYISSHIRAEGVEDLYALFGDHTAGRKVLMKAKLAGPYRDFFSTPLDYLHKIGRASCRERV